MTEQTDSVVIVTGASPGIGAAVARLAAREGARLVLAGRRTGAADTVIPPGRRP